MSDSKNWNETQARLMKDIETFARSKQDLAAAHAAEAAARLSAGLPALDGGIPAPQNTAAADAQLAATTPPAAATPAPGGSMLERLKREAEAKKLTESQRFTLQVQRQMIVSGALDHTFHYLRELCEQLNILKPAYPLSYGLLNIVSLDNLAWQEGRADFRMLPAAAEDRLYEQVTLRFRLGSGESMKVTRESPAHTSFHNALFENNIAFREESERNDRGQTARVTFSFPCEVKAGVIFVADYQTGDIRMQLRNLQRFGAAEYRVPPEELNQEAFDELARHVLGESNRFEKMFRRVA